MKLAAPGLLVEELNDELIIFFPNSPDSNNGEVMLVDKSVTRRLDIPVKQLFKSLQQFGKGITKVPLLNKNPV